VWTFAFVVTFATYTFFNDHFGRISPGRQIARYGALPFRDFFEPGFVLTELASASVQRIFGDNLLGEMILTSAFVAGGAACLFLLVRRIARSTAVAVVVSLAAVMTAPRPYDYDKFLFYPLGLLACWGYVERPRPRALVVTAAIAVAGGMFRYDSGLFIAASALAAIAAIHVHERSVLVARAGVFLAACAVWALPYLVFLQMAGGVAPAVEQMVNYGLRERSNTQLPALPSMLDGAATFSWSVAGAAAAIFYLFLALPVAAVILSRGDAAGNRLERAQLWAAAVMTLLVAAVILREPIAARLGGAIGPAAVLAAWMWRRQERFRFARAIAAILVLVALARATEWRATFSRFQHNVGRMGVLLADATATPPPVSALGAGNLAGLIGYVRRCTQPDDRLFAAWFAPELYFLSGRGFAGGLVATFGGHWSEPHYQRRIVERMASERVPLLLFREGDESFARQYPIVDAYVRASYQSAGSSTFGAGSGQRYVVFAQTGGRATGRDPLTSLPCFTRST
jgi:hypothetical protein